MVRAKRQTVLLGAWALGAALLAVWAIDDSHAASPQSQPAPSAAAQSQTAETPPVYARSKVPDTSASRPTEPAQVHVGIFMNRMTSVDITRNTYSADFFLWFRWKDNDLKPYETFELVNGTIDSRQVDSTRRIGDLNYACVRVAATLSKVWDVSRFPLGKQTPSIIIEDGDKESYELIYVPDIEDSGVDDDLQISGWKVESHRCDAVMHTYQTTYGMPRDAGVKSASFSRFIFTIQIERNGLFHSFKIFSGLYMAVLVAFTAFFVKPEHRLGVNIGSVFAVVASHSVISAYLPEVGVLTLCDKLHLVTVAVILISLFETAYAFHLTHSRQHNAASRIDSITFWIVAPAYLIANIWLFLS